MSLPKVLPFELHGRSMLCFYERVGTRAPRKGEFFVSGAIPAAYRAPNDLTAEALIVRPTRYAKRVTAYEPGDTVRL